jgi:uncharacterized protein DUF1942
VLLCAQLSAVQAAADPDASSPGSLSDTLLYGTLWEATATVEAVRGTVTPLIPNLNARADNGRNYQALWEAFMPQGISGATIPQGARSTGKIYFDVTGQTPSRVMYDNGVQDLLIWEK